MKSKILWLVGIVSAIGAFIGVSLAVCKYFEKNGTCAPLKSFWHKEDCDCGCDCVDEDKYVEEIPTEE